MNEEFTKELNDIASFAKGAFSATGNSAFFRISEDIGSFLFKYSAQIVGEESISALPIEELDLPVRAYRCLMKEDITTVGQLTSLTENDLIPIPNLGRKSRREIIESLALRGLKLKDKGEI